MFRLLIDQALDGATNMARDEALLILRARGHIPPTLRLYQWQPACLSLGRFQRSGQIDRERCTAAGVQVVRRPSGGRALLHDAELTYAVTIGEDSILGGGSIMASYRTISQGLLAGLVRLGVMAEGSGTRGREVREVGKGRGEEGETAKSETRREKDKKTSKLQPSDFRPSSFVFGPFPTTDTKHQTSSAACFDAPADYEAVVDGRKLIGSAQRREHGALLQHGAIPFVPHADRLCALLHHPPTDLGARMVTLDELLRRHVTFAEVADALVAGCAETWGVRFEHDTWTAEELALVDELRPKYEYEAWTWGR